MSIDALSIWISQLNFPIITAIAKLFNNDFIFLAIILIIAFIAEQGKKRNMLVLTLVFLFLVGTGIKYLVQEVRPCAVIPSKVQCPDGYSFPSSHAVVAFALAIALWKKPNGWLYTVFAVFVSFTRVYLGVHTVFDVLGGMLVGILGYLIVQMIWKNLPSTIRVPLSNFLE